MTDPRQAPYTKEGRQDGYAEASAVHPDPNSDRGWLCPRCGANSEVFYGQDPEWSKRRRRYVPGTDTRVCRNCFVEDQ